MVVCTGCALGEEFWKPLGIIVLLQFDISECCDKEVAGMKQ